MPLLVITLSKQAAKGSIRLRSSNCVAANDHQHSQQTPVSHV